MQYAGATYVAAELPAARLGPPTARA
eukprot:SAG22_NODE_19694_length_272_cov_0.901734_1_plen_25_part_01